MLGLIIIFAFVTYLLISIWVTKGTINWAERHARRPWLWGGLAAFVMYNLVFWDWLPTIVMHKYYCDTDAGFWVYKTPEHWREENPELTSEDLKTFGEKIYMGKMAWNFPYQPFENNPKRSAAMVNQRVYLDSDFEWNISRVLVIHKITSFIADIKNDEKLAQQITFGSGYGNPMVVADWHAWKFWLENSTCDDKVGVHTTEYDTFIEKLISFGVENEQYN